MPRTRKRRAASAARRAFSYERVSTTRQVKEGVSLTVQRQRNRRLAEQHHWRFERSFADEGISGRDARHRPGLAAALDAVCEARGVLVVYSLSRLARSAGDAERICQRLSEAGADLVSVTEPIDTTTAMGRAFFGIVAVFGRLESDLISERVKAVMAELRDERGYYPFGTPPAGFKLVNGKRVAAHDEQALLARIIKLRKSGATNREIADRLNREGVPTIKTRRQHKDAREGRWHSGTVWHLLHRAQRQLANSAGRQPRFVWTSERRQQLGKMTDAALAQRWRCQRVTVTRERLRLKIPAADREMSRRRRRIMRKK